MTSFLQRRKTLTPILLAALMAAGMTSTGFSQAETGTVPEEISDAVGRALDLDAPSTNPPLQLRESSGYAAGESPPTSNRVVEPYMLPPESEGEYVPPPVDVSTYPNGMYETVNVDPTVGPMESFDSTCGCDCGATIGPRSPRNIKGFHCIGGDCDGPAPGGCAWHAAGPIPFEAFAQGDYIGPARTAHVPEYRLRVDDVLEFVFRLTGEAMAGHYQLQVGDVLRVESLGAPEQNREVTVQPDGYITMAIAGSVRAAGRTVAELSSDLDRRFETEIKDPGISVSPLQVNSVLEEFRNTVDNRAGIGGQSRRAKITPAGTVQLPAIGSVHAQGLTLTELKREIEAAYEHVVSSLEVTPILEQRAPRFVYVVGEVANPGRFTLEGPTTAMQAIALAGSWNVGANLQQVIVFRRDNQWNLMATQINLQCALRGTDPCPAGEVWLRDSDIVLVPKRPIKLLDDAIELVFTRGVYSVFPVFFTNNLTTL